MDLTTLKSALLVSLVTASILWTVQFFAVTEFTDFVQDGSFLFEAVRSYIVIFMTILATELGITYIAQPKPTVQGTSEVTPTTSTQAVQNKLNREP